MDIELDEIRDYIAALPPFNQLPTTALDLLVSEITIRYLRRDTKVPESPDLTRHLYLVRKGALTLLDQQGKLREKLGEGDCFIPSCGRGDKGIEGRTEEDSLLYLVPCSVLDRLRKTSPTFDAYFSAGTNERLRQALADITERALSSSSLINIETRDLIGKRIVQVDVNATVQEAARTMTEADVSSLLITEQGRLTGILTDKDLRRRFICQGLPYDTPVSHIMTPKPHYVSPDTLGFETLLRMTRLGVHHLPVLEQGEIRGVISTTDLIRFQSAHGPYLVREVTRAKNIESLQAVSRRVPQLQSQMVNSGATADHIGQVVSSVTDAISQRLLLLAERQFGPAPVPFAWVAGGSQGRREQTSHSDQDNALILSDAARPEHQPYFENLAKFVCDGLHACGYYYCPGDAMASNPQWRQPLSTWIRYFDGWIDTPDPMALMLSSIFFDLRLVHGDGDLFERLQRQVLAKTRHARVFLGNMAANALEHSPPLGFFRTFVLINDGKHDNTFDIKHRGVVPIIDLARVFALSCGCPEVNTLDRLKEAARVGAMSNEGSANLIDAMEFIATLRMRHQVAQLKAGRPADNYLPPDELSPLERGHLRDAFKVIVELQEAMDNRYHASRFH